MGCFLVPLHVVCTCIFSHRSHSFLLQAASQWLELRLQLLGCGVVAGVAVIAVGHLLFPTNFVIV